MGRSPRERASEEHLNYLRQLVPSLATPTFNLQETLREALSGIDRSQSLTTSALGQSVGEQLSAAGVASGQPRIESYITALAPTFGKFAELKSATTSDLTKFGAQNQMDARRSLLALLGLQGQAIEGFDPTSTGGDIFGFINALGNLIGAVKGKR